MKACHILDIALMHQLLALKPMLVSLKRKQVAYFEIQNLNHFLILVVELDVTHQSVYNSIVLLQLENTYLLSIHKLNDPLGEIEVL